LVKSQSAESEEKKAEEAGGFPVHVAVHVHVPGDDGKLGRVVRAEKRVEDEDEIELELEALRAESSPSPTISCVNSTTSPAAEEGGIPQDDQSNECPNSIEVMSGSEGQYCLRQKQRQRQPLYSDDEDAFQQIRFHGTNSNRNGELLVRIPILLFNIAYQCGVQS
jgi:hypothetical protein